MIDSRLKTLLKIIECGSFVDASKELFITQPAVSAQIKSLENELNIKILDRGKSSITLTEEGKIVFKYAQKMAGLENVLIKELKDRKEFINRLTVGITHTAESNSIAEALGKYSIENDKISIKIISDSIKNLYRLLKTYEIDLAVVEGRDPDPNINYVSLDTDSLVLVVSPKNPLVKQSMVSLNDLKKERMILRSSNSGTRNLFVSHLHSNNMELSDFNVALEVDNVATIKDLVQRDFGVSILPKSVCLEEIKKNKLVIIPIENLSMMREINIAYLNDFGQNDIISGIIKAYNEIMNSRL